MTANPIRYRTTGVGTPVVFIHGAAASGQVFSSQFQAFRDSFRCYFVDLPGHGRSPLGGAATIAGYAQSVAAFIETIGVSVFVAGHSMGGAVALELALTRPHLVRGLILACTGCRLPVSPKLFTGLDTDYEKTLDRIVRWCFSKNADPEVLRRSRIELGKVASEIVRADFQECAAFDRCADLHRVEQPALVVCGTSDLMMPVACSEQLNSGLPNSEMKTIDGGSHSSMLERPEEFNAIVRTFLEKTGPRKE